MPDNRNVAIYRKSAASAINLYVRSVEVKETTNSGMPVSLEFTTDDGREGTIHVNHDEIEAVVITPIGDPDKD
jgi:hypothetical protein